MLCKKTFQSVVSQVEVLPRPALHRVWDGPVQHVVGHAQVLDGGADLQVRGEGPLDAVATQMQCFQSK